MGMRITRRQMLQLTGALGVSSLVAACAPGAPTAPDASTGATTGSAPAVLSGPKRGGTLFYGFQNDWNSMDPLYITVDAPGPDMIYNSWVRWKQDEDTGVWEAVPELAESWDLQADTATLNLRKGVTFHDGTEWNAAAAKWNLDRMIFDPTSHAVGHFSAVDRSLEDTEALAAYQTDPTKLFDYQSKAIEIVDDYTIRMHLTQPFVAIMTAMSNWVMQTYPISPEAFLKQGKDAYARNPVGTGPFRFAEWVSGSHVIVERNPDYWAKDAQGEALPYLDKIHYRLIIDDTVRLLELKGGNIHFTDLIAGKDIAGLKAEPNMVLIESAMRGNNYRCAFDSQHVDGPFRSRKLRQAFLYALDREAMVNTLGFGSGRPLNYLLPQGSWAYDETVPYYGYNKELAAQLVQEALAEDPTLAATNGKIPFDLTVIERAVDKQQAEMIKQMVDAVGFDMRIDVLERAAYVSKLRPQPGEGAVYDAATHRNGVSAVLDPDQQWRAKVHSQGNDGLAHLQDPAWDDLVERASATYDFEERKALYKEMAQKMFDDPWNGYLWVQAYNWAHSDKVHNFKEPSALADMTEVWLDA